MQMVVSTAGIKCEVVEHQYCQQDVLKGLWEVSAMAAVFWGWTQRSCGRSCATPWSHLHLSGSRPRAELNHPGVGTAYRILYETSVDLPRAQTNLSSLEKPRALRGTHSIQSLQGFANYLTTFLPQLSHMCKSLIQLLNRDEIWTIWTTGIIREYTNHPCEKTDT